MQLLGPWRRRLISVASAAAACASILAPTSPAAASSGAETFVTMLSESGDWVGGGTDRYYHPGNGTVSVSGTLESLTVGVSGGNLGQSFSLRFAAPPGEQLAPGDYLRAQRAAFRAAGRPGIDVSGDGRGCNTISGRFRVELIEANTDGAITGLWIVYEQHCEGGRPALIGEVRYQAPGAGGTLVVGPRRIRWPDTDPGSATKVLPITVVNPGAEAVVPGPASLSGPDQADYDVRTDTCQGASQSSGGVCRVWVRFSPTSPGTKEAVLSIPQEGFTHEVALTAFVFGGTTQFTADSDPGDWIGGGGSYDYHPGNARIVAGGNNQRISASINGVDGIGWNVTLDAPDGDILAPGSTYTGALRHPFNGSAPGMSITRTGRGCNTLTGTFRIQEIAVNLHDELERLAASFEQHCEGGTPALRGILNYRATDPVDPPDLPEEEPEEFTRSIGLRVRARRISGSISSDHLPCTVYVPVRLQRKRNGRFVTFSTVSTDGAGSYVKYMNVRKGRYRAMAPAIAFGDGATCLSTFSIVVRR